MCISKYTYKHLAILKVERSAYIQTAFFHRNRTESC